MFHYSTSPTKPRAPVADGPGTVPCAAAPESAVEVRAARAARRQAPVAQAPVVGPRACRPQGTTLWEAR